MRYLLFYYFLIFSVKNYAQIQFDSYVLDTNDTYYFEVFFNYYDNKFHEDLYVTNINSFCEPKLVKYTNYQFQIIQPNDSSLVIINPEKIKALSIRLRDFSLINAKFNLKTSSLNKLPLYNLNKLFIDIGLNDLNIFFKQWSNFKTIHGDSIKTLDIQSSMPKNDTLIRSLLSKFPNLEKLKLPVYVNHELLSLKHLQDVKLYKALNFFPNYLVNLPLLLDFDEQFEFSNSEIDYAQKQFFFENLNINSKEHHIYIIDSIVKQKKINKINSNGESYILYNDFFSYDKKYIFNDTIAKGYMFNGKKLGVWAYKLFPPHQRYPYYFNHDSLNRKVSFPFNGKWQYKFFNGNVAIEGFFKEGKKDSLWKFYKLNGELESIKTFKSDYPFGLFIDYSKDLVVRKYYFSIRKYIVEEADIKNKNVIYYTVSKDLPSDGIGSDILNGDLLIYKNGKAIKRIKKGTVDYNKNLKNNFLKYLYAK